MTQSKSSFKTRLIYIDRQVNFSCELLQLGLTWQTEISVLGLTFCIAVSLT